MAADILEKEENRDDVKPMSIMESSAGQGFHQSERRLKTKKRCAGEDENNNSSIHEPAHKRICNGGFATLQHDDLSSPQYDAMPLLSPLHSHTNKEDRHPSRSDSNRAENVMSSFEESEYKLSPESPPDLTLMLDSSSSSPWKQSGSPVVAFPSVIEGQQLPGSTTVDSVSSNKDQASNIDAYDKELRSAVCEYITTSAPYVGPMEAGVPTNDRANEPAKDTHKGIDQLRSASPRQPQSTNDVDINSRPRCGSTLPSAGFQFDWKSINSAVGSIAGAASSNGELSACPISGHDQLKAMEAQVRLAVERLQSAYNDVILEEAASKHRFVRNTREIAEKGTYLMEKTKALTSLRQEVSVSMDIFKTCQEERDSLSERLTETVGKVKDLQAEQTKLERELKQMEAKLIRAETSDQNLIPIKRSELSKTEQNAQEHLNLLADIKRRYIQSELSYGRAERKYRELHKQLVVGEEDFEAVDTEFKQMKSDVDSYWDRLERLKAMRKERLAELLEGEEALVKIQFCNRLNNILIERQGLKGKLEEDYPKKDGE